METESGGAEPALAAPAPESPPNGLDLNFLLHLIPGSEVLYSRQEPMTNNPISPLGGAAGNGHSSLTERVRSRVAEADRSLDRRLKAARRRSKSTKAASIARPEASEKDRSTRSLRRVFHELGTTHREYRQRTGQRVPPDLREAAHAFKREPSLTSLVTVAGYLDELGILAW